MPALAKWGRIDVLDNNVGIGSTGWPGRTERRRMASCVRRQREEFLLLTAKHVACRSWKKQGKGAIVNVSSIASIRSP